MSLNNSKPSVLFPVQSWYPLKNREKKSSQSNNSGLELHRLIAHGQTEDALKLIEDVLKLIAELQKIESSAELQKIQFSRLIEQDNRGLTPLAIATMAKNAVVVEALLKSGNGFQVDPAIRDKKGWMPLYYAILQGDKEMIKLLKATKNANIQLAESFAKLLSRPKFQNDKIVAWYRNERRELTSLTAGTFKTLVGGAEYSDRSCASRETLMHFWKHPLTNLSKGPNSLGWAAQKIRQSFVDYRQKPTKLYLSKNERFPRVNFGVCAPHSIPLFGVIACYSGLIKTDMESTSSYCFNNIDAGKIRDLGSMVQDGFPNAYISSLPHINGIESRMLIVAGRPIAQGEEIFISYGAEHPVAALASLHIELNTKDLEEFISSHSLIDLIESLQKFSWDSNITDQKQFEERAEAYLKFAQLNYLFTRPTAFLHVLFKGLIDIQDLLECYKFYKQTQFYSPSVSFNMFLSHLYLPSLHALLKNLKDHPSPIVVNEIRKCLVELLTQVPVGSCFPGYDYINSIHKKINSLEDWQIERRNMEKIIQKQKKLEQTLIAKMNDRLMGKT